MSRPICDSIDSVLFQVTGVHIQDPRDAPDSVSEVFWRQNRVPGSWHILPLFGGINVNEEANAPILRVHHVR